MSIKITFKAYKYCANKFFAKLHLHRHIHVHLYIHINYFLKLIPRTINLQY